MSNGNHKFGLSLGVEGLALGGRTGRSLFGVLALVLAAYLLELTPEEAKEWLGIFGVGYWSAWSNANEQQKTDNDDDEPPTGAIKGARALPLVDAHRGGAGIGEEDTSPYTYFTSALCAVYTWACTTCARSWTWRRYSASH